MVNGKDALDQVVSRFVILEPAEADAEEPGLLSEDG